MQIYTTLAVFLPGVFAQDPCENWAGPGECPLRRFNQLNKMFFSQVNSAFSDKELDKMIQNYGCHCFRDNERKAVGQGAPVDSIDATCLSLQRCRRCIDMEFYGPDDIDAHQEKYRYSIDSQTNAIDCSDPRNTAAQRALCLCDKEFAETLGQVWNDADYNGEYWLFKSNVQDRNNQGLAVFDRAAVCVGTGTGTADACCGADFPNKFPYDSMSRSCCDAAGQLYDESTKQCCSDGVVRDIGSGC